VRNGDTESSYSDILKCENFIDVAAQDLILSKANEQT